MAISPNLETEIFYPHSDGQPMAESDSARDYLIYGVETLDIYFQSRNDVYVSGNSFIYYEKGVPSAVISPDVYVVFGVEKKKRLSYKVWEENNQVPSFVLEVTSASTKKADEKDKPIKYTELGVQEYFQYDPTGDYLAPQLKGSRLHLGKYHPLTPTLLPNNIISIYSETLGLDLRLIDGELRFYNPQTGEKLLSHKEEVQARQEAVQARQEAIQAQLKAIPRLLAMGLSVQQVAEALSLSVEEVRKFEE